MGTLTWGRWGIQGGSFSVFVIYCAVDQSFSHLDMVVIHLLLDLFLGRESRETPSDQILYMLF